MKILALDQATKVTGYSIWDTDTSQMITQGKISFSQPDAAQRIHNIKEQILVFINDYKIDKLYLEDIQLENQFGVTTYKMLAELIGVLQELAIEQGIPYEIIPSATWRHTCGIVGKKREDKKANTIKHVIERYGLDVSDDVADAICIGEHAVSENACAW